MAKIRKATRDGRTVWEIVGTDKYAFSEAKAKEIAARVHQTKAKKVVGRGQSPGVNVRSPSPGARYARVTKPPVAVEEKAAAQRFEPPPQKPRSVEVYDPREEQIRAQRQGLYEAAVRKVLGLPYNAPFRDGQGNRLDLKLKPEMRRMLVSKAFAIGTAVPQKYGRLEHGRQVPTGKTAAESRARYEDVDHLIRNRQDYEETLALGRKGLFFRVVPEETRSGLKFFIWPMMSGQRVPRAYDSEASAQDDVARAMAAAVRGVRPLDHLWKPPVKAYTKKELNYWLPPESVW